MPQKFLQLNGDLNVHGNVEEETDAALEPVNLVSRGRRDGCCHANVGWDDGQEGLDRRSVTVTWILVLFLTRTTVLEPDLRYSLAQPGHVSDSLEILTVRVAVDVKVCLKYLQLFFGEGCSDAFWFTFVKAIAVIAICGSCKKLILQSV